MNAGSSLLAAIVLLTMLCLSATAARASALPEQVEISGVEFVLIPAGDFSYTVETGAAIGELAPGTPHHRDVTIWLDAFYMAKFEARARDLVRFLNASSTSDELRQAYMGRWEKADVEQTEDGKGCTVSIDEHGRFIVRGESDYPATYLSWNMADAFARWMGFRLPTEAEWQKAARGGDNRIWPWGDSFGDDTFAHFGQGYNCQPIAVESYPKGRSAYGIYQMSGNVSEHVADWYNADFDSALTDGLRNPRLARKGSPFPFRGPKRIMKGGSWSPNITAQTIGFRRYTNPDVGYNSDGLRFAVDTATVRDLLARGDARTLTTEHKQP